MDGVFFEIKEKFSWLFTFFIPLKFAPNFNGLSYSLINKFEVIFTFCISINAEVKFKFF